MMFKRRDWTVSHSRDSNRVILQETEMTLTVRLWEAAETVLTKICDMGLWGHGLTNHKVTQFLWQIPVGRPKWDTINVDGKEEPWLENSLASAIIDIEDWVSYKTMTFVKEVESIPIDEDTLLKLWPDLEWLVRPDQASWSPGLDDE